MKKFEGMDHTTKWEAISEDILTHCQASKHAWDHIWKGLTSEDLVEAGRLLDAFIGAEYRRYVWAKAEIPDPERVVLHGRTNSPEWVEYRRSIKGIRSAISEMARKLGHKDETLTHTERPGSEDSKGDCR